MIRLLKKFLFLSVFSVAGLCFPTALLAQTSLNNANDILANTTLQNGVYWFSSGEYSAVNTVTPNQSTFPGNLGLGSGASLTSAGGAGYDGLTLDGTASFRQSGGSLFAVGADGGRGLRLLGGDFTQTGGAVYAGGLRGGSGIALDNGSFTQSGGTLFLSPGGGTGFAMRMNAGNFSGAGELRPILDFASGGIPGRIYTGGTASIAPSATLQPMLVNTLGLEQGAPAGSKVFLETGGGISGQYAVVGNSPTIAYTAAIVGNDYTLDAVRKYWVSSALEGSNADMVAGIELQRAWVLNNLNSNGGRMISDLYTALDTTPSSTELERGTRRLTAWADTNLPLQAVQRWDMLADSLHRKTSSAALGGGDYAATSLDNTVLSDGTIAPYWAVWLEPLARFDNYSSQSGSFADMQDNYYGAALGAYRKLEIGTLSFSANYLHGKTSASGFDADHDTIAAMAAFRTRDWHVAEYFKPWAEIAVGYSYTFYDQTRQDLFGIDHDASPDQNSVRVGLSIGQDICLSEAWVVTPIIGLDYTWVRQDSYTESNENLIALNVDSVTLNSLRARAGGEIAYAVNDSLRLGVQGFYRLELADTRATMSSGFVGAPIAFEAKGEKRDRSSGVVGANISWHITERVGLQGSYNYTVGDHFQGHEAGLAVKWKF